MKKVLVVCGNGIASSSVMLAELQDYLNDQSVSDVNLDKKSLMDCTDDVFNGYDLIVSSTKLDKPNVTTPIIVGTALLTGINEDSVLEEIKDELTK
ncbi:MULTISPECIES: PTS galactitol transporter subunit IIB [Lactobacillus]|uniref:PTS Gat IIB n=1 Tax=Lactobacillus melliventris TaxID=1218507 RepID=A0A0F4LCE5_9LACO|nr:MULTISPECIES: PTS galactitol transporter subunit IIB [Lactobacillus]MCT6889607.1 PTS galactitol transporter subunit IIB [Lactobacillus sp.]KJY56285.1 PTS Gat IIB [Lactobacillus melliventris]MBH9989803.1 PTS galactitol transporter subunit IIB [Lactobacillus sp. M0392]MBI0024152.1 PTS galactitol transporter subunit IIB [Lactobacillus sp. W8171]MBI0044844.1 PTS galactitol transporter subunit IIB [Lactobacillus sp. M0393]